MKIGWGQMLVKPLARLRYNVLKYSVVEGIRPRTVVICECSSDDFWLFLWNIKFI